MNMLTRTPRIGIYGRHSTAMQAESSSRDQAAACGRLVQQLGGAVVEVYLDPEMSGYRRDRPGFQRMLEDMCRGDIDTIVSEALDRIARDPEDIAWFGKKLSFHRAQLHTISEGHVDEVKLAVAGLLGSLFLKNLVDKTIRGMHAAVLAGRFAGGRAYGFKRSNTLDAKGELVRGLLEIDEEHAEIVRRIFADFASGLSSIQIATRLNEEGVPGPRGGQWNASTIRGDPKKLVGILNNPLYVGRLVWGRRQWRKNPDSDRRERLYRLRDSAEWTEVAVPDLRIVDDGAWEAVRAEFGRRQRDPQARSPAGKTRAKHLLSGLIKCSSCGSSYTISGKDYYRCAGQKERGTCGNAVSVRKGPLEIATLAVLKDRLLTEEHIRLFIDEFRREIDRLSRSDDRRDTGTEDRLRQVEVEIANLAQNLLAGLVSPTIATMLSDREAEKAVLETKLASNHSRTISVAWPTPSDLRDRFRSKVGTLAESLNDARILPEAAIILAKLIECICIDPDAEGGPEAEVIAKASDLVAYAGHDDAAPKGGAGRSMAVVAGTGFEPVTFRL